MKRERIPSEQIKAWMKAAGVTIIEAAELCEVDDSTIVRWRRVGVNRAASVDRLRRAAEKVSKVLA